MNKRVWVTLSTLALIALSGRAQGQELLSNGGFEMWAGGIPNDWFPDDSIAVNEESGTVHGGDLSAKVTLLTQNQTYADFEHDTVLIDPSQVYALSGWFFDDDVGGRGRLLIRWYSPEGEYLSSNYGSQYTSDQGSWQQLSMEALAPENAGLCVAGMRFYDDSAQWDGDAVFYVDDFSLVLSSSGPETLSIHEIQGEADSSPYVGEIVVTTGVVTGVMTNTSVKGFFLEEKPGGAWKGIFVYTGSEAPEVTRGDSIWITAEVAEYYGLTELKNIVDITIISYSISLPAPVLLPTGEASQEMYEGVLLWVENAICTDPDLGYGEWEVNDTSGPLRIDDLGVTFSPVEGNPYRVIGPLYYSYGDYKMEPRDEDDIVDLTGVREKPGGLDQELRLLGTKLYLTTKSPGYYTLRLYRPDGRLALSHFSGYLNKGTHVFELKEALEKFGYGVYFYSLGGSLEAKGKILWLE